MSGISDTLTPVRRQAFCNAVEGRAGGSVLPAAASLVAQSSVVLPDTTAFLLDLPTGATFAQAAAPLGLGSGWVLMLTTASRADDAVFAAPLAFCDYGAPYGVADRLRSFTAAMRTEGADVLRRVQSRPPLLFEDFTQKNGAGRDAALGRIIARMARPLVGRAAAWRYTVALASPVPGYPCDVVEVRSVCAGRLRDTLCMHESAWCLDVTDHAIGRLIERGSDEPRAALLDSHDALCGLTDVDLATLFDTKTVPLRAGSGAFVGNFHVLTEPPPHEHDMGVYFMGETWLHAD